MSKKLSSLSSQIINVVENAAIACYDWIGRGDSNSADQAAVHSMRTDLNLINFSGTIVIGEGERDEAPMLYIGEKVGLGGDEFDIALDPLEGTSICANAGESSLVVIAVSERGSFLHAPDVYMEKIAVGGGLPTGIIDLDNSIETNLKNLAAAKKCGVNDLTAMILDRPRHKEMIAKVREIGARVRLIGDGDVAGVIACSNPDSVVDIYMGIGGAPEGVLAAAALRTVGGQMMGRLLFDDDHRQIERARAMGISDLNKKYIETQMASGSVIFACAGVTDGYMTEGVKKINNRITVSSVLMDSNLKRVTKIKSEIF